MLIEGGFLSALLIVFKEVIFDCLETQATINNNTIPDDNETTEKDTYSEMNVKRFFQ